MFSTLFGDGRIGAILAVIIGLCLLGLIAIYARRAFGRGVRPGAARSGRQPRLGIVDAFDLDRHRQLVLVRRDNVEHLIMIGGPNDLLIEEQIVRAQPSGLERREPTVGAGDRQPPRVPIEPASPTLDVKTGLEPAPMSVTPPPLRPTIEPVAPPPPAPEPVAPPPPLARPTPVAVAPRPVPPRPVPAPPMRPAPTPAAPMRPAPTLTAPRPGPTTVAPPAPPVAPPAPPAVAQPEPAKPADPVREAPRIPVNIDSLEEEMAKLLGRPVDPPKK